MCVPSWESRFRKGVCSGAFSRAWRRRVSIFTNYVLSARFDLAVLGRQLSRAVAQGSESWRITLGGGGGHTTQCGLGNE